MWLLGECSKTKKGDWTFHSLIFSRLVFVDKARAVLSSPLDRSSTGKRGAVSKEAVELCVAEAAEVDERFQSAVREACSRVLQSASGVGPR